jgi:hypothetical protein
MIAGGGRGRASYTQWLLAITEPAGGTGMQVQEMKLTSLLEDVKSGKLVIPDFQRDFVWTKKQIEDLLNSIINGYFIGTILLLESPTANLRFAPRLVRGVEADPKAHASVRYVLDGQQRVTSLFYAFFEPSLPLGKREIPTRFFLNLKNCDEVVGIENIGDLFRKLFPDKEQRAALKALAEHWNQKLGIDIEGYPTMAQLRSSEALTTYFAAHSADLSSEQRDRLNRLLQSILDYRVAIVTLPDSTPDDEIVSTFDRINQLGTRLDIFDLAVARYYPLGIRLNELKKKLETRAEAKEILTLVGPEALLKAMALANGTEPKNKNLLRLVDLTGDRDKAQAEFYTRWEGARQQLEKAVTRLREAYGAARIRAKKNRIQLVPYTTIAVPLACILQEAASRGSAKALYDKIDLWYWTAVFTGRYAHSAETQAYADVKAVVSWFDNDAAKLDIGGDASNVVQEMRKASRTSALGKAFYNLLILAGSRDFMTGQGVTLEDCEVDHVFPKSKFPNAEEKIFNTTGTKRSPLSASTMAVVAA